MDDKFFTTKEINELSSDILDVEGVIKLWARKIEGMTNETLRSNSNNLTYKIEWKNVKIEHKKPVFSDAVTPPTPKMQILFRSSYVNNGDTEQENQFHANRETVSVARVIVQEGVCFPTKPVLIPLPDQVAEANAGFPKELNVCKSISKSVEERLQWSVDTKIPVGANKKVEAEMMVEEREWVGNFTISSAMSGKVKVTSWDQNGKFVRGMQGDLSNIFAHAVNSNLNTVHANVQVSGSKVLFESKGEMFFRFGVQQHVEISQAEDSYDGYDTGYTQ